MQIRNLEKQKNNNHKAFYVEKLKSNNHKAFYESYCTCMLNSIPGCSTALFSIHLPFFVCRRRQSSIPESGVFCQ